MRIATTHWQSGLFPDDYVTALAHQFGCYGHRVTVLGNGATAHRLLRAPRGENQRWWHKLEWFAPWNRDLRPAVVFDLDTLVVGDPQPFLDLDPTKLWMIREFLARFRGESGIFVAPDNDELCDRVWQLAMTEEPGADGPIMRRVPHSIMADVIDGIYSWEKHCRKGPPQDARVVCFHGRHKPMNVGGWATESWQASISASSRQKN